MQPTSLGTVERKSFSDMDCSVAQCLEVVGDWWTMLIVRDTFLGVTRFEDFQRRLGISRNILQQRLTKLVDTGILVRVPYSEHPPRFDYRLTPKGRDLWPVLTAMRQWGDDHAAPDGPPLEVVHDACGSGARWGEGRREARAGWHRSADRPPSRRSPARPSSRTPTPSPMG